MKELPQEIESHNYLVKLGKRVATIRAEKNLTQEDLAFLCGWDPANLRKIEGAKTNPTVKSLLILCNGLDIELKDLFDI